ncbi:MAG TPA: AtpZ/AtpI family protein [Actinomycetota bacterium]|nr:AtpZ/AtpI family protein [Actinomycetota bacterium]
MPSARLIPRAAGTALSPERKVVATPGDDRGRVERSYLRYAGAGFELAAAIFIPTLFGVWLDHKIHTTPLFTIVLCLLGFAGGAINLIRSVSVDPSRGSGRSGGSRPPKPGDRPGPQP